MSFRQFGGLQYAARNNIVSSKYNTNSNLQVTGDIGQVSSYINVLSDLSGNFTGNFSGNISGNISGGATGDLLYQTAPNNTSFLAPGNSGLVLTSNGPSSVPTWQDLTQGSIMVANTSSTPYYIGLINPSDANVSTIYKNTGLSYNPTSNTLSCTNFNGNATTATDATNIASGTTGDLLYQSDANVTSFLSPTLNNYFLTCVNGLPAWAEPPTSQWDTSGNNIYFNGMNSTSGNVGINKNNPLSALDVVGSIVTSQDCSINSVTIGLGAGNVPSNTALGQSALQVNTTGSQNTAVGQGALQVNTTGSQNTAVGQGTLNANNNSNNTAVGSYSLYTNTSGSQNTALGQISLYKNNKGNYNTGLGQAALYNFDGSYNTAIGYNSGVLDFSGNYNTYLGANSSQVDTNIYTNSTAIGANALINASNQIMLGGSNVSSGIYPNVLVPGTMTINSNNASISNYTQLLVGQATNVDPSNDYIEIADLSQNLIGNSPSYWFFNKNSEFGYVKTSVPLWSIGATPGVTPSGTNWYIDQSGNFNTNGVIKLSGSSGTSNYVLTSQGSSPPIWQLPPSGVWAQSGNNIYNANIGGVGIGTSNPSTYALSVAGSINATNDSTINNSTIGLGGGQQPSNTAFGYQALSSNTTGTYNVAIAYQALKANTSGGNNVAIGYLSLNANTSGVNNTAIGYSSLQSNTTGNSNFALGLNALQENTIGSNNTAIGVGALNKNNADENIAIGKGCMYWANSTTASNNVAIGTNVLGSFSLNGSATCSSNVAIGYLSGGTQSSYYCNTLIGANTDTGDNTVQYSSAIGYNAIATTSNQIMLGGNNGSGTYPTVVALGNVGIGTTNPSTYALSVAGSINATTNISAASITAGSINATTSISAASITAGNLTTSGNDITATPGTGIQLIANGVYINATNAYTYFPGGIVAGSGGVPISITSSIPPGQPANFIFQNTSSARYKQNIIPLPDDRYNLDNFMKLKPIQYSPKEEYGDVNRKEIGFIAEDADDLNLYELVAYNADKTECKYFYYEKLTSFIVKIVQQQQKKIEELEAKINSMNQNS